MLYISAAVALLGSVFMTLFRKDISLLLVNWHSAACLGVFLSHWFTVIGVVGALIATVFALKTYRSNGSIKKWELIKKTYEVFLEKDWYEFYKRIQGGEEINLTSPNEEKLLNESLTLFDQLNYFRTQGFLDKRAWEYIACEVQNFGLNNSVWKYIKEVKKVYIAEAFPENIIPFTGFPDLLAYLPKEFRVKIPLELRKRFNNLSDQIRGSYEDKTRDIPDDTTRDISRRLRRLNLRRTATIRSFAKAEGSILGSRRHRRM